MSGDPRRTAAGVLLEVLREGHALDACLRRAVPALAAARDRGLARELCFGVLRRLPRLEAILARLLRRPLRARDLEVRVVLLLGLYQLLYTRIPPHAAVAESVAAAGAARPWARGLVNAVLRGFLRDRERILAGVDATPEGRYSHPRWLIEALRGAWPGQWRALLAANDRHPPMTLRVNARRCERGAYLARLEAQGIAAAPAPHTEQGVVLAEPREVTRLPGFDEGVVSVQDAAAQLAAQVLAARPAERVLDACAAPGGKTLHVLEREPAIAGLVAVERDAARVPLLHENLHRTGLAARVLCADAASPRQWWDGTQFQRILLDAPCSGTGVIRRHPDIKLHRRPADVGALVQRQAELLDGLWPLLARHGRLLYATCSILPEENDRQVQRFLECHGDAAALPIAGRWGRPLTVGRQILTGEDDMDGFYYALLEKH